MNQIEQRHEMAEDIRREVIERQPPLARIVEVDEVIGEEESPVHKHADVRALESHPDDEQDEGNTDKPTWNDRSRLVGSHAIASTHVGPSCWTIARKRNP